MTRARRTPRQAAVQRARHPLPRLLLDFEFDPRICSMFASTAAQAARDGCCCVPSAIPPRNCSTTTTTPSRCSWRPGRSTRSRSSTTCCRGSERTRDVRHPSRARSWSRRTQVHQAGHQEAEGFEHRAAAGGGVGAGGQGGGDGRHRRDHRAKSFSSATRK